MHRYTPIDPLLLDEAQAHQLFQNVAEHYLARAGGSYEHVEQLSGVPPSARVIWRLWLFLAEVGGNGVRDYLWNYCHSLSQLQEVHRALGTVGAEQMRGLLEAGVRSSLDQGIGEFLEQEGAREWAAQFTRIVGLGDEELNSLSMELAYPAASEIVASYIRANRKEL